MGEYIFNKKRDRTRTLKSDDERITVGVQAIVSLDVFRAFQAKRHERSPSLTPARIVNPPTLLSGLLCCANCGAGVTLATRKGKGGKYRDYKCNTRSGQSIGTRSTPAVPMGKLDPAVLSA